MRNQFCFRSDQIKAKALKTPILFEYLEEKEENALGIFQISTECIYKYQYALTLTWRKLIEKETAQLSVQVSAPSECIERFSAFGGSLEALCVC